MRVKLTSIASLLLLLGTVNVNAESVACDRSCLRGMADTLLTSMVAHDPAKLPLLSGYQATENGFPAAPGMMAAWRIPTDAKNRFYIIDPVSSQVFVLATLVEGNANALLFGRIKVQDKQLSELELYVNRSRGEGGFIFDADGLANLPKEWTQAVPANRLPSRAELLTVGRSIFDNTITGPESAADCLMMENGGLVGEDPEVLKLIMPPSVPIPEQRNPDGSVPIPCATPEGRPTDPLARTDIIDEEQGIVVSMAMIHGMTEPYLATQPTLSAFVPLQILDPYLALLKQQRASSKFTAPAMQPMPGTEIVAQIHRVYDGKLQGMHLFEHGVPTGSVSPWVNSAAQ